MRRTTKKKALAVAAALLAGWILLFTLSLSSVPDKPEISWRADRLVNQLSWIDRGEFLPLNVSYQVLAGSVPSQPRFLTVGISSVQRKKGQYLKSTLDSIFSQSSAEESADMVVVVLIADFDQRWRLRIVEEIQTSFPSQLSTGQLQLVHVQQEYYPPLTGLKRNFNDAADRVSFRSKQNIDYAFLVHYTAALGQYYLQLEDDVGAAKNFLSKIRQRIAEQDAKKQPAWACLEFSKLGYIGKLYKSHDLPLLARFLFLFYQEMPCDWLMTRFHDLLAQKGPIAFRPSLFQHTGTFSSFQGTHNKLTDKDFEEDFANPEADVFSNMSVYQKHSAQMAWAPGGDFFWARSPARGDYVTAVLKTPAVLTDVAIETGDAGKDVLISAEVELGRDVVAVAGKKERSCGRFVSVGRMERHKFEAEDLDKTHDFASSCLRIRVTAPQSDWVIIKRIRVAAKPESKTSL
uniref:Zgc:101663 n=1 Tax=Neogobius melanostomus TaxID=47308 RepID=A0A8C6TXQ8_9GOBI